MLLCQHLLAQPFQIGHATLNLTDAARNNRVIATELYYPADVAGNNVPMSLSTNAKFPAISFGHGFVMTWDAYQNIWEALVPEGYIIAFPKTEDGISPSHAEFGKDLAFVLSELSSLGQDTASWLYNRVDTMTCLMGHSMGGGAAFLAAQFNPTVKSLATLAPAETNPSAIQAATSLALPSLLIAGANDCVTPPPAHQIPLYDSLQSTCKTLVSINGGSHCQMAENNVFCSFGESTCTPPPTITRTEQHLTIKRYLLPWLNYQLKNDCVSGAQFDSLIATDTSIVFQRNCLLCSTTALAENAASLASFTLHIYPNPFRDQLFVKGPTSANGDVALELYAADGRRVVSQSYATIDANETLILNLGEKWPDGIYFLKVTVNGMQQISKVIKQ